MTVSKRRRRVATTEALLVMVIAVGLAVVLGGVGAVAIYHTKDGDRRSTDAAVDAFAPTPTGLLAIVDDAGALADVSVFAINPDGELTVPGAAAYDAVGGTLVPLPVAADVSGGHGDERYPLNETVKLFGVATLVSETEALLGVSIDGATVLDRATVTEWLRPLAPIEVELPHAVADETGQIAGAGSRSLSAAQVGRALAAIDPDATPAERYDVSVALWRAISAAIGPGRDDAQPIDGADDTEGLDIDELTMWLFGGPVDVVSVPFDEIDELSNNPRGVDAVALDRAAVVTLFAHIAPRQVSAPNTGLNFVVHSGLGDEALPAGLTRYDIAYGATAALVGGRVDGNVVGVTTGTLDIDGQAETVIEVAAESLVESAHEFEAIFGPVEVRVAERRIVGVDAIVTVGTNFAERLAADSTPVAADS